MEFLLWLLLWRDATGSGGTIEAIRLPRCDTPAQILLFLALLVGGIWLIRWCYRRESHWVERRRKLWMAALRAGALAVVLFIATGALLELVRRFDGVGTVIVLIDRSASMDLADRLEGDDRKHAQEILGAGTMVDGTTRAGLLAKAFGQKAYDPLRGLGDNFKVEMLGFGEAPTVAALPPLAADSADSADGGPLAGLPKPTDRATQLGAALADAARRARGRRLDAVIVASDGGWNRGEDPVAVAQSLGAPVIAIGVGATQSKDLEVSFIFCEEVVFKNDRFILDVRMRQRGFSGRKVKLVIRRTDAAGVEEVVKEEDVEFGEERELVRAVDVIPDKEGIFAFSAELTPQPEESNALNNKKTRVNVQVIDKKLHVLVVEDAPRWEFRFLRTILETDRQRVIPTFVLRQADQRPGERPVPTAEAKAPRLLRQIPADSKGFKEFDTIVIGDVAPEVFTGDELKRLEEWVRVDAGGLILVAGRRLMPSQWSNTVLDKLLPVEVDDEPPLTLLDELSRTIKDGVHPNVTPEGSRWAALRFSPDPGENELLWRESEPFRWFYPVRRLKSGAAALLVHPTRKAGDDPMPLMAVQRYGRGQVVWVGSDETWRWRFKPGAAQHRRLWGQLTSSLGMAHLVGHASRVQIDTDRAEYMVGDHAQIVARVLDADFNPSRADAVTVTIERELNSEQVTLAARRDQPGTFAGEWVPGATGRHRIVLEAAAQGGGSPDENMVDKVVSVVEPQLEQDDGGMREDLLQAVAKASDGAFLPLHRAAEAADVIKARERQMVQKREEVTLWNAPGVLVLLVLFLGLEWWFRKREDML